MSSKIANRQAADAKPDVLSNEELQAIDAYWRAANHLSVGQIYLHENTRALLFRPVCR